MHRHLIIDGWSRRAGWLQQRDARVKLALLLALLIAVSTTSSATSITSPFFQRSLLVYAGIVVLGAVIARLPIPTLLLRAAWVLPFSLTFACLVYWSGDASRALAMLEKSYLSACATLLFVATTPLEEWTAALEQLRVPQALVLVLQFLYRYLFLIVDQAHRMVRASASRKGESGRMRGSAYEAAAGAIGVLFALSWKRSTGVHQAMLARGFHGHFPSAILPAFRAQDAAFLAGGIALLIATRFLAF